jgi:hypothetical protein
MDQEEYIKEKMNFLAMNIDELSIGQEVIDEDNSLCKITNKTKNSVEIYVERKTKQGVNSKQWFSMFDFNKRFNY